MKKILSILLVLIMILLVWLNHVNRNVEVASIIPRTNEAAQSSRPIETNSAAIILTSPDKIESTMSLTNALTATNIKQWKGTIGGLHKSPGLSESWDMEIANRTNGIPVPLIANGQTNFYKTRFINIDVYQGSDGRIMEAQMHSPIMNIDETRELGVQLCDMLGVDSKDFSAWCDKVGNHWMDQPLYATGKGNYGFQILNTFDNEKPWMINFVITPR